MLKRTAIGALALALPVAGLVTATTASAAVTPTVVNETSIGNHWYFDDRAGSDDHHTAGTGTFVDGPATPPLGTGSLALNTPSGNDKIGIYTDLYAQTALSNLTDAKYATYLNSSSSTPTTTMPTVQVQVGNATTVDGMGHVGFTTLVFEPIYCYGNGAPQFNTWQSWDGAHTPDPGTNGGCWWSTNPIKGSPDRNTFRSLADIEADNPDAVIGLVGINLGRLGATQANVDALELDFANGGPATYDFEHFTPPPVATVSNASIKERNSGLHAAVFTVSLTGDTSKSRTVAYTTADGTATIGNGPGNPDYVATSGTLTFAPGQTSQTVSVKVIGDKVTEPDENFSLQLSQAGSTATVNDNTAGTGTIVNDDGPPVILIKDATTTEGNNGFKNEKFSVRLDHASTSDVTFNYTTVDGTATSGTDYEMKSGMVTIVAGDTSASISVKVIGDRDVEPNETYFVTLSNSANATIGDGSGTGIIRNDD